MASSIAADLVAAIHALYVGFVVFGLVAILAGYVVDWRWIRNPYFRISHLIAILFVCAETVFGIDCPLTTIENALRLRAGQTAYPGQFIGYWLDRLIFYNFPPWVFAVIYLAFSAAIGAMLWLVPIEFTKPHPLPPTER